MATLADSVVARLREWGVQRVFGYAGDGVDPLLAAFDRADGDPELVTARHEEMAAFMATGSAKYTGEMGVCLATQGPGAVHLLTGLYDAKLDRVPVVAIVGQVVSTALGSGYQQEVDLHTLFKDVCAQYVQTVVSPEQLPMVLDNAIRTARATSSPTCVVLPHDVQKSEDEPTGQAHGLVPSGAALARPRVLPTDAQLDAAAALLDGGERVALLVGQGAYGAAEEVLAVAERTGAGITTSLLGKPVLDERLTYHCGVMGHLGTTASTDLISGCDTLLIVGSSDPWTEYYPAPGQAKVVQIDISGRQVGAKYPVDVPLVGDSGETLRALLPRLRERGPGGGWRGEVQAAVRDWRRIRDERAADAATPLNPQTVVHELNEHLPADAQVAIDVGSVVYWYARFLTLPPGVPAHLSSTLASMGCGMPYGIAAKLADPTRPVVVLAGDGAMQMNGISELVTVAHRWRDWSDPRFVVLVLSNQDLAEVTWEQREMEGDPRFPTSQQVPEFPFAAYAELLGLQGLRVDGPAALPAAWAQAWAADRPCLVEAIVDPDVPLLPPRTPDEKAEQMRSGLAQEPGGAANASAQLDRHLGQERGSGS